MSLCSELERIVYFGCSIFEGFLNFLCYNMLHLNYSGIFLFIKTTSSCNCRFNDDIVFIKLIIV